MIEHGVYTALVTPFIGGKISFDCLKVLLDLQLSGGVAGIVMCGTTGEAPTLSSDEYEQILHFVVKYIGGKIKIFAGVGAYDPSVAVKKMVVADRCNVDAMLVVTPFYNKPTQVGLVDYFEEVSATTDKPIILYSVPSRCGVEVAASTVGVLAKKCKNICAIKEATDSCARVDAIREATGGDFVILSGNDSMTIPFMSLGAKGVISVASNLFPGEMVRIVEYAHGGDYVKALEIYKKIYPIIDRLFIETNPLPIKFLLQQVGRIVSSEARSPLGKLSEKSIEILRALAENMKI